MRLLYSFLMYLAEFTLPLFSIISSKIKKFQRGRLSWENNLKEWRSSVPQDSVYCFHCASLGEYEMIVPLLEAIKKQNEVLVVVSFFSPSGYEQKKNDALLDGVFYLPIDTPRNARKFLEILNPDLFGIVKYDLWFNLLDELKARQIPTILVNGFLRPDHFLAKSWAKTFRKSLIAFDHFFVQNQESKHLLKQWGYENSTLTHDLRFDRVSKEDLVALEEIEAFKGNDFLLVAGSSWPEEERLIADISGSVFDGLKVVIVPHDIGEKHIEQIVSLFDPNRLTLWSDMAQVQEMGNTDILLIDEIGMLKRVYLSADACFIGGGFSGNVHNVLEAAVVGMPLACGPLSDKFPEIKMLENEGLLSRISTGNDLRKFVASFKGKGQNWKQLSEKTKSWVVKRQGGSDSIVEYIQ